jgi:TNF(Tumour Necrosis Factor) family
MDELALNRYFTLKDGTLTVKLGGLYYFYSQV